MVCYSSVVYMNLELGCHATIGFTNDSIACQNFLGGLRQLFMFTTSLYLSSTCLFFSFLSIKTYYGTLARVRRIIIFNHILMFVSI